ncbi:MAG: RusA family crossover junction endodeoxyribonuclease [Pirellulales bacterium]
MVVLPLEIWLKLPPSSNHVWRRVGNRTILSRRGRQFRKEVCDLLRSQGVRPMSGPLEIMVDVYPPDRRRRDLDNYFKSLLDALAHGGAYHDDSQLERIVIRRRSVVPGGKVRVLIQEYSNVDEA